MKIWKYESLDKSVDWFALYDVCRILQFNWLLTRVQLFVIWVCMGWLEIHATNLEVEGHAEYAWYPWIQLATMCSFCTSSSLPVRAYTIIFNLATVYKYFVYTQIFEAHNFRELLFPNISRKQFSRIEFPVWIHYIHNGWCGVTCVHIHATPQVARLIVGWLSANISMFSSITRQFGNSYLRLIAVLHPSFWVYGS